MPPQGSATFDEMLFFFSVGHNSSLTKRKKRCMMVSEKVQTGPDISDLKSSLLNHETGLFSQFQIATPLPTD